MVQKALMEHGGEEGLTAEVINEYLIATNYDLPPHHDRFFPYYLNELTQRNKIILDPSSGRYTIPGRAEVQRLRSQAEEVLCKFRKAEDRYIKNLAYPFVKEHHLSKIKKVKALLAQANISRGYGGFKIPTAGEMRPDPGHDGSGRTAEPNGGERPGPIVNPARNLSVRDPGLPPRRGRPGYLSPMGRTRPRNGGAI
ncbi:hypothetical protein COCNU_06G004660 [Cocos nucifera]|uniref:Uncharacterized protein n=1 Tax=Cocos nucifera TaxID=13894 RepID=A0A8K0IBC3_COCNU|nr:hypothetical protein COCNU_06G004660 [Cocos nucifera]